MKRLVLCFLTACWCILSGSMPLEAGQTKAKALPGTPARISAKHNPMRIIIVRSNTSGCEPDCAEWISAEGEIMPETPTLLRRVIVAAGARKLPLFINSEGGDVSAGYAMGRLVRQRKLEVGVSRTTLDPCNPTDKKCTDTMVKGRRGRASSVWSYCNSSCVFVLAGGATRHVYILSQVGVHQFATTRTFYRWRRVIRHERSVRQIISSRSSSIRTPKASYDRAARYFSDMGIGPEINSFIQSASNDSIHRLSRAELGTTNLMTDGLAADTQVKSIEFSLSSADGQGKAIATAGADAAAGLFNGDAIISKLLLRPRLDDTGVDVSITPRTGKGAVAPVDLVASIRVGDLPSNTSSPQATPASGIVVKLDTVNFCALRLRDSLSFDLRSRANAAFTGETVEIPTARFKDIAPLFHKVCDE